MATFSMSTDFSKLDDKRAWTSDGKFMKTSEAWVNEGMKVAAEYGVVVKDDGSFSHAQPRIVSSGGSAVVPFIVFKNQASKIIKAMVGVNPEEDRPVTAKKFKAIPRGFADYKGIKIESPKQTAVREFGEHDEASVVLPENRFEQISGAYNMDTAWFFHGPTGGVTYFSCEVFRHEVELAADGRITFRPGVTSDGKMSIVEFIDINLIRTECGITELGLYILARKLGL